MTPVLVTTDNRGVFFGYLEEDNAPAHVKLSSARNIVHWTEQTRGAFGLASHGPNENCKVGPACPTLTLYGITAVAECTPEAAAAWEAEPWG